MNEPTKLREEFDAFSDCYDEVVIDHLSYHSHEIIPAMMLPHISTEQPEILDLGCGTGISSTIFFDHHYNVTGVDISPGMIKQAQKRPFKNLVCQSLETEFSFKKDEFDAVVMLGVLEFIEDPEHLLKNICDLLKDRGLIGVTFPMNIPVVETQLTVRSYTEEQIKSLISNANLEIIESRQFLGYDSPEYTIHYTGYVLRKIAL